MTSAAGGRRCGLRHSACLALLALVASADAAVTYTQARKPCASHEPLMQPFFGDLHVHTRYSLDAAVQGTRTTPDQAYRFARGERIGIQPWSASGESLRSLRLRRPLDFAMVSDHAELLGEVHMCDTPGARGYDAWECLVFRHWPWGAYYLFNYMASMQVAHLGLCGAQDSLCRHAAATPWAAMREAAEYHYDRSATCAFTTFIGYEWTGMQPDSGGNLHRNVVFRNAEVPRLPISFIDEPQVQNLWRRLDEQCNHGPGRCDALAIPHNSNLSAGYMFNGTGDDGGPMTADYARLRQRFEPLLEIVQKGGASECFFGPGSDEDEFCAFEPQPIDNLAGFDRPPGPETGFARRVLADGLSLQRDLGVNPYRLGFVGSTDTHLGAAGAVDESGYVGHGDAGVSARQAIPPGLPDLLTNNPGGLAVLWAQENSRDALFEALRRRETYATSGPRIISRFFGGWQLPDDLCARQDRIAQAYAGGVPMGGLLGEGDGKPSFLILAGQDSGTAGEPGVPLQRVQIIKGSLTAEGEVREQVVDVAGDSQGGASVDTRTCETRGPGFGELCAVWKDENFRADEPAYYYSRVLENPSCRWSQRICVARGVDCAQPETIGAGLENCCAPQHQKAIQERAWSSPIWYTPGMPRRGISAR